MPIQTPLCGEVANNLGKLKKEKAFADGEAENTTRAYEEFLAKYGSVSDQ